MNSQKMTQGMLLNSFELICKAARNNDKKTIEELTILGGVSIDVRQEEKTPITKLIEEGCIEGVQILLSLGASMQEAMVAFGRLNNASHVSPQVAVIPFEHLSDTLQISISPKDQFFVWGCLDYSSDSLTFSDDIEQRMLEVQHVLRGAARSGHYALMHRMLEKIKTESSLRYVPALKEAIYCCARSGDVKKTIELMALANRSIESEVDSFQHDNNNLLKREDKPLFSVIPFMIQGAACRNFEKEMLEYLRELGIETASDNEIKAFLKEHHGYRLAIRGASAAGNDIVVDELKQAPGISTEDGMSEAAYGYALGGHIRKMEQVINMGGNKFSALKGLERRDCFVTKEAAIRTLVSINSDSVRKEMAKACRAHFLKENALPYDVSKLEEIATKVRKGMLNGHSFQEMLEKNGKKTSVAKVQSEPKFTKSSSLLPKLSFTKEKSKSQSALPYQFQALDEEPENDNAAFLSKKPSKYK